MALTDNLISYWKMDEFSDGSGAVTREDSHSTNDLTDNNTTLSATGKISLGADFELSNTEYLSITDAAQSGLDFTSDFSVSLWHQPESQPSNSNRNLASKFNSATGNHRSWQFLYFDSGGTKKLGLFVSPDGTGTGNLLETDETLNDATFYYLVVTWDASASTAEFFVNGTSVGTATGSVTALFDTPASFTIGATANPSQPADGIIDEVGIWNRIITGTEITELYNAGAGLTYPFSAASGPANLKTYNTNVKANIKTINTNPIANIKSLNTNV